MDGLTTPFSLEEIKHAVFASDRSKSLGLVALAFYQENWDLIKMNSFKVF